MGRTAKLGVQKKANGKWQVVGYYVPDANCPGGFRRHRPVFDTRDEAQHEVEKIRRKIFEEGVAAHRLDDEDRTDAVRAKDILKPHGATLEDAAKHYAKHLAATKRSITFNKLKDEFLALKKKEIDAGAEGAIKAVDYRDIKPRFEKFATTFGERLAEEIQSEDINNWLEDLKLEYTARSRANFRKAVSRIFTYAVDRRYCSENPVAKVRVIKIGEPRKPIFTAEQMRKILSRAPSNLIPYLAIGAFAGLRPSEVQRLRWSEIRWEDSDIFVNEHGKTGKRYVEIQPNLALWLEPYRKKKGAVSVPQADRKVIVPEVIPILSSPRFEKALVPILAISTILNVLLGVAIWQLSRKPKFRTRFGFYWDSDLQPHCPACESPMQWGRWEGTHGPGLLCGKCKVPRHLADDGGNPIPIEEARSILRKEK